MYRGEKMRVLLAGGGTGGHIYPALAIANKIKDEYPTTDILYVGTNTGLEAKIVPKEGWNFAAINVEGWQRKISLQAVRAGFKAFKGVLDAIKIIKNYNPQVVIGTGGYVCGPVVLAARLLNIPTIIHEQNALPGITNRLIGNFVDTIMITFPESKKYFKNQSKIILTGLPIREKLLKISKEEGRKYFNLDKNKKTLLVTGGSRGAKKINEAMLEAYKLLLDLPIQIIHITGEKNYKEVYALLKQKGLDKKYKNNLILKPYLFEMEYALACADLCISRAGATFLAEITAKGIPGILIPYPYAAENHQQFNAQSLVNKGAAEMILDKNLTGTILSQKIIKIISDDLLLKKMAQKAKSIGKPNSLENIVKIITNM